MSTCPITVRPGQILGFINGRPVRAIAGASPDGDGAAADAANSTTDTDAGKAADQAAAATAQAAAPDDWDGKIDSLPPAVQKVIKDAQTEAANASTKARTTAREQAAEEARNDILKKLGLTKDGEKIPDPSELAKQLKQRDDEMATMRRERGAEKAARAAGADVDALLDSRSFAAKLEALDPTADSFTKDVAALVKKALDDNPKKFKLAQAAGASSVDHAGGPGERRSKNPMSLADAVSGAYGT